MTYTCVNIIIAVPWCAFVFPWTFPWFLRLKSSEDGFTIRRQRRFTILLVPSKGGSAISELRRCQERRLLETGDFLRFLDPSVQSLLTYTKHDMRWHDMTQHNTTVHCVLSHYNKLHCIALRYMAVHYMALHCISFRTHNYIHNHHWHCH